MTEKDKGTWGTIKFDGPMATQGYALNKMCYSFNSAEGREEFKKDEAAYCDKFGLTHRSKKKRCSSAIFWSWSIWAAVSTTWPNLPAYWA